MNEMNMLDLFGEWVVFEGKYFVEKHSVFLYIMTTSGVIW